MATPERFITSDVSLRRYAQENNTSLATKDPLVATLILAEQQSRCADALERIAETLEGGANKYGVNDIGVSLAKIADRGTM